MNRPAKFGLALLLIESRAWNGTHAYILHGFPDNRGLFGLQKQIRVEERSKQVEAGKNIQRGVLKLEHLEITAPATPTRKDTHWIGYLVERCWSPRPLPPVSSEEVTVPYTDSFFVTKRPSRVPVGPFAPPVSNDPVTSHDVDM